jgi:hypothetical protein
MFTKLCLASAFALALAVPAQATDAYEVCGPAFADRSSGNSLECWVRVMAHKVQGGEPLTLPECLLINSMHGHVSQCDRDHPETRSAREDALNR